MEIYYDGLNDFHKLNEQERLASSAQLVYLHLLHMNNRSGNRGYVHFKRVKANVQRRDKRRRRDFRPLQ